MKQVSLQEYLKIINPILEKNELLNIETINNNTLLQLFTSNKEHEIFTSIKTEIDVPIKIAVNPKQLNKIITSIKSATLELSQDKIHLIISANNIKLSLEGFETVRGEHDILDGFFHQLIEMDKKVFDKVLDKIIYIPDQDSEHTFFRGAYCIFEDTKLTAIATDGSRLNVIQENIQLQIKEKVSIIIPNKILKLFRKIASDKIILSKNNSSYSFKVNNIVVIFKAIDGTYPDHTKVIPAYFEHELQFNRKVLITLLSSLLSSNKDKQYKGIMLERINDTIQLSNTEITNVFNKDYIQTNTNIIDCKIIKGNYFVLLFNCSFMLDALKSIEKETITLKILGTKDPMIIEDDANVFVIMPQKL
jgi:DNA polymerase-3 subunit beta